MKLKIRAICIVAIIILLGIIFFSNQVFAANTTNTTNTTNKSSESTLVELKEKELSSLEDYEETYGSKTYGLTAYILHKVQIYSIPLCFLGIVIGAIHDYVIGVRHLEAKERGLAMMVAFITIGVICQVLPLVFTIVVKFGRE